MTDTWTAQTVEEVWEASEDPAFTFTLAINPTFEGGGGVSLPIAQSDVTGLTAALAAKASATMSVGGALSGALPSPGLNTEAVQDLVGAMAGDGMTYDDAAGELNVIAPPHSIAWCLVPDTFDPETTPLPVTSSTNLYIYTGIQGDTYPHAGLWYGTATVEIVEGEPVITPGLLERHPHTVTTGDFYSSRTWIDLRTGSIVLPEVGPTGGIVFPEAWVAPQTVNAIISGNNGPNLPVWSLIVEQDRDGESLAPSIDFLADVDTTTVAPTSGDVLSWDGTNWVPDAAGGGGTVDVVSNVAQDRLLGRTSSGPGDSEELTATQVRTLLNVADGAAALSSSTPAALGTALAGVATTAARADHVHEAPAPDHSPGVISAAKIAGGFATGTPLFAFTASTTVAVATGTMIVAYGNRYARTDLTGLSINVSASSLSAGQSVTVVCYALDSDGVPTGSPAWSETITVGASTGWLSTGTIARALPSQYAIGILNPSGNAGPVTLTAAQPVPSWVVAAASANRAGLTATSLASPPDVSSFTIDSASSSTKWAPQQNVPIVWARRA